MQRRGKTLTPHNPHPSRDPLPRHAPHTHDDRFPDTAIHDPRTRQHRPLRADSVIRPRRLLPPQRLHNPVLHVPIVVVEDPLRPKLLAILEVARARRRENLRARRDRQLDDGGADAGAAAPDEESAVDGFGGVGRGKGQREEAFLVETRCGGGDAEGKDGAADGGDGGGELGDGVGGDGGEFLEGAVRGVGGGVAVAVAERRGSR